MAKKPRRYEYGFRTVTSKYQFIITHDRIRTYFQFFIYRNVIRFSKKTDVILALDPAYCVTLKCRTMSIYSTRPEDFRFPENVQNT